MNREQLDEIRKRVEKATPGPWYVVGPPWNSSTPWVNAGSPDPHQMSFVCDLDADLAGVEREDGAGNEPADAEFIAAARTDVPALLDEIDRRDRESDRLWAMVGRVHAVASAAARGGVTLDPAEVIRALEAAADAATPAEGSAEGGTSKGSEVTP